MTDRIGIDEQIAFQSATAKYTGKPEDAAILATLRDYKRIQEAKVPEPVAFIVSAGKGAPRYLTWTDKEGIGLARVDQCDYQPLYGPEVLDILRRETAKNERIMELLPRIEKSLGAFVSDEGWAQSDMDTCDDVSALLAQVEKETNDGK